MFKIGAMGRRLFRRRPVGQQVRTVGGRDPERARNAGRDPERNITDRHPLHNPDHIGIAETTEAWPGLVGRSMIVGDGGTAETCFSFLPLLRGGRTNEGTD